MMPCLSFRCCRCFSAAVAHIRVALDTARHFTPACTRDMLYDVLVDQQLSA